MQQRNGGAPGRDNPSMQPLLPRRRVRSECLPKMRWIPWCPVICRQDSPTKAPSKLRRARWLVVGDLWQGGSHGLVFPNDEGQMWSKNARTCEVLWKACDNCNLPRIRVHDLRHCYAAFYLMAGGNLYDLQKNLGHHSVAFTAEIYGHLSADNRVVKRPEYRILRR